MASRKFIQDYNNNQVPFALIELIFIRQEEAGNVKDISVFLNQEGHNERLGGFTWEDTSEKHNFWRKIFEGNYSEFTSLKYTDFKEGDYVVARTNIHGHWFSNDEVLQLGGQYWNGSLEKHFGVKCKRYPEGGGMSYAFQANYTIRHATAKEIRKSIFNPEEFLKGDYIVITGLPVYKTNVTINYHLQYPEAFIFKQRDTNKTLLSEIDAVDSRHNGYDAYKYNYSNWRFATKQEIKEYNRIGKPYDVTKLKQLNKQEQNGTKSKSTKVHRQNSTISRGSSERRKPVQSRTKRVTIKKRSLRNTQRNRKREKTIRVTYESRRIR